MCQMCYENRKTLNVHHRHYLAGREPWDYPGELLVTLCEGCHKREEENIDPVEMFRTLHFWGYFNVEIVVVLNKMIQEKIQEKKTTYAEPTAKGLD